MVNICNFNKVSKLLAYLYPNKPLWMSNDPKNANAEPHVKEESWQGYILEVDAE